MVDCWFLSVFFWEAEAQKETNKMNNLKTFPIYDPYACASEFGKKQYIKRVLQWKEAFERQLREKLTSIRNDKKNFPTAPIDYFLLREILGES